jgi:hypothetical protein
MTFYEFIIIWLENKIFNLKKCRGASPGAPLSFNKLRRQAHLPAGRQGGPPLRINKSIFMVVGDPSGS